MANGWRSTLIFILPWVRLKFLSLFLSLWWDLLVEMMTQIMVLVWSGTHVLFFLRWWPLSSLDDTFRDKTVLCIQLVGVGPNSVNCCILGSTMRALVFEEMSESSGGWIYNLNTTWVGLLLRLLRRASFGWFRRFSYRFSVVSCVCQNLLLNFGFFVLFHLSNELDIERWDFVSEPRLKWRWALRWV